MYVATGRNSGHPVQVAVGFGAGERKTGGHRGPTRCFVFALDHALDVETPDIATIGWKPKNTKWDAEFQAPTVCVKLGSNVRHLIPALIPCVVVDLRVLFSSKRVDRKHICSPVIVKGIQSNAYGVVFPVDVIVPVSQGVSDDPVGIGIVGIDTDIKRLRVGDEPHFRPLRCRSAGVGFQLRELSDDLCLLPGYVGQVAVNGGRRLDKRNRVTIFLVLPRVVLCCQNPWSRTYQHCGER